MGCPVSTLLSQLILHALYLLLAAVNDKCCCTYFHITSFLELCQGIINMEEIINKEETSVLETWNVLEQCPLAGIFLVEVGQKFFYRGEWWLSIK